MRAAVVSLAVLIAGYQAIALAQAEGEGGAFAEPRPVERTNGLGRSGVDPGKERSEFHFVLSFPLGVMNGFDSHAGTPGSGFFDFGSSPYTSTIYELGLSLGLLYEAEWFGIGAQVSGFLGAWGTSLFADVHGLLYLSSESVSPFIGAGLGVMNNEVFFLCFAPPKEPKGFGPLTELQFGLEFGRLSPDHTRVQLSLELLLPLYDDDDGSYPVGLLLNTSVAF